MRAPYCECVERVAASPCPFCNSRPVERKFLEGRWYCDNCGESGWLSYTPGTPPRETAVPESLDFG